MAGTVFSALLLGAWWLGTQFDIAGEPQKAARVWTALWPILSLVLLLGAIFVSAFTAIAIKPCPLCSVFWIALALAALTGVLCRLPGSWLFYLSLGSALVSTYLIVATPFQFTVHGFLSPYMARVGLPPGSAWPTSLLITDVETYVVLGNCSPCNAKSGQAVIDSLSEGRPMVSAVLVFEGSRSGIRIPDRMNSRPLQQHQFKVVGLTVDSPPYVFEVQGGRVVVSQPASQYLARAQTREVVDR